MKPIDPSRITQELLNKIRTLSHDEVRVPELGPCRIWDGSKCNERYGIIFSAVLGGRVLVHRAMFAHEVQYDPVNVNVCHRCDVEQCIQPAHLFDGSQSDNMLDCVAKGRHQQHQGRLVNSGIPEEVVRRVFAYLKEELDAGRNYGSIRRAAEIFGISRYAASDIKTGNRFSQLGLGRAVDLTRANTRK